MGKQIKLTQYDNGANVEEEIEGVCHLVTPDIFCARKYMLMIDTGTFGWNPYAYVKVNGEFGLLTAHRGKPFADSEWWWYNRDPSRNGEFMYWHSTSNTDSNKIFLYWDDLRNLPEVEYACREDTALKCTNLKEARIKLKLSRVGYGIHGWKCSNNDITIEGDTVGVGQRWEHSQLNRMWSTVLQDVGRRGICISHDTSTGNVVNYYAVSNSGMNESIEGSIFFADGAYNNHVYLVEGDNVSYGLFWPVDGGLVSFGERTHGNIVVRVVASNCFNAVQENSGHSGNRILNLTTYNCVNSFDQSDFNAGGDTQDDRLGGYGKGEPPGRIIRSLTAFNSGPFGVRTPDLSDIKTLRLLGNTPEFKRRWEYGYYPTRPDYEGWNPLVDAVNPQGPWPRVIQKAFGR